MHKLTLETFGLSIDTDSQRTDTYRTAYQQVLLTLPGNNSLLVAEYFPDYGYLRLTALMQDALAELYEANLPARQAAHWGKRSWLQYERPFIRHLHLVRLLFDPKEQHTYVQFLTALWFYANFRPVRDTWGSNPIPVSPHTFQECLTVASLPNLNLAAVNKMWHAAIPFEMVLLAGQGKYVGLIGDLL